MCGRYSLALRPSQILQMLYDANMEVDDYPPDEGDGAPRPSYNFAPGYHGVVYRADVPDWGAGPRREHGASPSKTRRSKSAQEPPAQEPQAQEPNGGGGSDEATEQPASAPEPQQAGEVHYKLQSMKWGLIPFWTKRNPDYTSMLKTINCRDDSLASPGGMWASMKGRKRCIVIAQGFYEWLKPSGPRGEKIPHFVKRADGKLMCFAGLWDCVTYEDEAADTPPLYTYTIITTDSNAQLKFLHDRMPVILDPGSDALTTWLDPARYEWSRELQSLLKPYKGELEVYPVSKEVGKVGNNSPNFIIPVASKENKSNIANFFANAKSAKGTKSAPKLESKVEPVVEVKEETRPGVKLESLEEASQAADDGGMSTSRASKAGVKREADPSADSMAEEPPAKKVGTSPANTFSPSKAKPHGRTKISATSNGTKSPVKGRQDGSQKITRFFANSA